MKSIIKNLTHNDIIDYPFPHIDIQNALSDTLIDKLLSEIPSKNLLNDYFNKNSDQLSSAVNFDTQKLEALGLKVETLKEFVEVHSSNDFKNNILNLFNDYLLTHFPLLKTELIEAVKTELFVNPFKTKVSSINNNSNTFIRGPHLDDAMDISVYLFYLKHKEDIVEGGSLDFYKYNKKFSGFRRDIWWDDREIHLDHVQKVKSIPYENNRFVMLLDGITSIHGVTPVHSKSNGFRYRISGGISTPSNYRHYNYKNYLNKYENIIDEIGIIRQKVIRKYKKVFV